jgi:NADPH-dependent ferric siderophore reductase
VSGLPEIRRVRHETKRRNLTVARVERFGSTMLRVVACGEELEGFISLGFDDHVKLFFPIDAPEGTAPAMRDFTPRRYDVRAGELWIDFFLHDSGPAATWASQVSAGQTITVGGPRGSSVISPEGIDMHLLIGDETGLPAMGRRLDELPAQAHALAVIETDDGSTEYPFESRATTRFIRVKRSPINRGPAHALIEALRPVSLPTQGCFAWAALESQSARAIRRYLLDERSFDKRWVKAAGYWQRDAVGVHEVIQDEE